MLSQRVLRGMPVLDSGSLVIGRVEAVVGDDELALVRVRRFGAGLRLLPVSAAEVEDGVVRVPFTSVQAEDAPVYERDQPLAPQADHARAHWGEHAAIDARGLGFRRLAAARDRG